MLWFFQWIRAKTKDAVLAGLSDAVAEIESGDDLQAPVEALRQKLALPAPEPEGNGSRVKKALK